VLKTKQCFTTHNLRGDAGALADGDEFLDGHREGL